MATTEKDPGSIINELVSENKDISTMEIAGKLKDLGIYAGYGETKRLHIEASLRLTSQMPPRIMKQESAKCVCGIEFRSKKSRAPHLGYCNAYRQHILQLEESQEFRGYYMRYGIQATSVHYDMSPQIVVRILEKKAGIVTGTRNPPIKLRAEYDAVVEELNKDINLSANDSREIVHLVNPDVTEGQIRNILQVARNNLGLVGKRQHPYQPPLQEDADEEEKPSSDVPEIPEADTDTPKAAIEEAVNKVAKSTPDNPVYVVTNEQIVQSVKWNESERVRLQAECDRLAGENTKLEETNVRLGKKLRDATEKDAKEQNEQTGGETTLTGKPSAH